MLLTTGKQQIFQQSLIYSTQSAIRVTNYYYILMNEIILSTMKMHSSNKNCIYTSMTTIKVNKIFGIKKH